VWNLIGSFFYRDRKFAGFLIKVTGFLPSHLKYYEMAFIHKSASVLMPGGILMNNERLEYLGDAILDAIVADYLFKKYPGKDEGFLTKMRSRLVKRKHLNLLAIRLGLDKMMTCHINPAIISRNMYGNAFEALIGALYMDKGYQKTSRFIEKIIDKYIDLDKLLSSDSDYKSQLIEWAQKYKREIIFESHEESKSGKIPIFLTHVKILGNELGRGYGNSKKESEQKASKIAIEQLANSLN